jgi:arylsulfatase A-like enzyme
MRFLRAACAGVAGASLPGLLLVLAGIGWQLDDAMLRERVSIAAANALIAGWLGALLALLAPRARRESTAWPSVAFWCAAALTLAAWSWIGLAAGAVLLLAALAGRMPGVPGVVVLVGALLHLLPFAAFWLLPVDRSLLPLRDPVPALPAATAEDLAAAPVSASRPDVLLIVADTLRADAILDPRTPTPTLDALRARGVWAEHAIAPCNQTLPSHMAMLMALDLEKTGMRSNESRWPKAQQLADEWGARPVAERFRAAGWRTAGVSANPLLESSPSLEHREQTFAQGIEAWHGMQRVDRIGALEDWAVGHTILRWLMPDARYGFVVRRLFNPHVLNLARTNFGEGERTLEIALGIHEQLVAQPNPYFFFLNWFDPHAPYAAPPPFAGTIARPEALPPGYGALPGAEFRMRVAISDGLQRGRPASDFADEYAFLRDLYREEVAYTDWLLGRLLAKVEESGRPTLILFVGDHGEAFGEHDNLEHRWTLHEEELRVPFVLTGPGVPPGLKLERPPELVDGVRTLLELCGVADAAADGVSVLTPRPEVLPQGEEPLSFMVFRATVREGRWKMIAWVSYGEDRQKNLKAAFAAGTFALDPHHLYDLESDPEERRNLIGPGGAIAPAHQAVLNLLVQRLRARMQRDFFPMLAPRELNPKQRAQLDQLGYIDDTPR